MVDELSTKIKKREAVSGVIDLGYVGLPLVNEFLINGYKLIGFDIDKKKIKKINSAESYIEHIDNSFIEEFIGKNRLYATDYFLKIK